ncbi:MAG: hypothetical protein JWP76_2078 [Dactylosporangium sp.]|nr:hypothetical protein [Dactylosporangium sp.]
MRDVGIVCTSGGAAGDSSLPEVAGAIETCPRARGCRRRRAGQPLRAGVSGTATSRTRAGTCLPDRTGPRPAGDRPRPDSSGARAAGRHPEVAPSEGSPGRTPRGSRRVPPDQQIRRPDGHRAGVPGEVSPEIKAPGTEAEPVAYMHRGGAQCGVHGRVVTHHGPPFVRHCGAGGRITVAALQCGSLVGGRRTSAGPVKRSGHGQRSPHVHQRRKRRQTGRCSGAYEMGFRFRFISNHLPLVGSGTRAARPWQRRGHHACGSFMRRCGLMQ